MDWSKLHEVTSQSEKPAPGWLFREIIQDVKQHPQDVPDVAEYLMRCVLCDVRTTSMKACLTIRHVAEEVPAFQQYMQRCPDALKALQEVSEPPKLAQARSLEREEAKVAREIAARALQAITAPVSIEKETQAAQLKTKIQGFGNYQPPEEEPPPGGAKGLVNKALGYVADEVVMTVEDFREKGAIGTLRDGVADAGDLLLDGLGAVWGFLGGRKAQQMQQEDRICRPVDGVTPNFTPSADFAAGGTHAQGFAPQAQAVSANPYAGAFGQGVVGANHAFHSPEFSASGGHGMGALCAGALPSALAPAPAAAPEPAAPAAPAEPEDLLMFDDEPTPSRPAQSFDLLSMDVATAGASAGPGASGEHGPPDVLELKAEGNKLVRSKKYGDAVKSYEAALHALGDGCAGFAALGATLYANMAMCYLQLELYRRAVDAASRCIELDTTHAKAYYRRCLAYKKLKQYEEARRDLDALQFCKHQLTEAEMSRLRQSLAGDTAMLGAGEGGGGSNGANVSAGGGASPDTGASLLPDLL